MKIVVERDLQGAVRGWLYLDGLQVGTLLMTEAEWPKFRSLLGSDVEVLEGVAW